MMICQEEKNIMAEGPAEDIAQTYSSKIADVVNRCSGSDASYRIDGQEKLWAAVKRKIWMTGAWACLKLTDKPI